MNARVGSTRLASADVAVSKDSRDSQEAVRNWVAQHTPRQAYIRTCLGMYVCMYACMHVCMYACMYVCMYVLHCSLCCLLGSYGLFWIVRALFNDKETSASDILMEGLN